MSQLKVGVIGVGFGASVQIPALLSLPQAELVGVASRDHSRTELALSKMGFDPALAARSVDALLDTQPDVVMIAVPPHQNEALVVQALDAGSSVLSEKPLAGSSIAAWRMADAAERLGRTTAVDFQFAELPIFQHLRSLIQKGAIGSVRHVNVTWLVQSYAQHNQKWSWKTDETRGGGVLTLLGSHLLYLAEWIFGPVEKVWAAFDAQSTLAFTPAGAIAAEDNVQLRLVHASGAVLSVAIGNASPGIHRHLWHISGETGSLILDNPTPDYMHGFELRGTLSAEKVFVSDQPDTSIDGRLAPFRALAGRFLACVAASDKQFRPNFRDGARVQALMDAIRASSRSGSFSVMDKG